MFGKPRNPAAVAGELVELLAVAGELVEDLAVAVVQIAHQVEAGELVELLAVAGVQVLAPLGPT
jgi:hypothetical protein